MAADRGEQTASGLFVYGAEQKTYEVGNIRLGGQPGAQPTALIGSIFYHGHAVFTDEDRDQFDTSAAERDFGYTPTITLAQGLKILRQTGL